MNHHDEMRDLIPLAAAGVLNEADIAALRLHCEQCSTCGEELKSLEEMAWHLAQLPNPEAPAWLAQRTLQRVKQTGEEIRERRWNNRVLAFVIGFSWVLSLAGWPVAHIAAGIGLVAWLEFSFVLGWITAGSAAVILGSHSNIRGRNL